MLEIGRDHELLWEWHGEHHLDDLQRLLPPEAWEHFRRRVARKFGFDWAHNNTLQVIPPNETWEKEKAAGGPERFRPGNIVFSYRSVDIIGVIDRETSEIVWAWGPGVIDGQHKPHMLRNGNILIFDNGTLRGYSRVIELNPLTEEIEWEYTAAPPEDFFSGYISGAQRLPNGNTLICEGGKHHLFEVTPDKEIVWDFVFPWHEEGGLGSTAPPTAACATRRSTSSRCWRRSSRRTRKRIDMRETLCEGRTERGASAPPRAALS